MDCTERRCFEWRKTSPGRLRKTSRSVRRHNGTCPQSRPSDAVQQKEYTRCFRSQPPARVVPHSETQSLCTPPSHGSSKMFHVSRLLSFDSTWRIADLDMASILDQLDRLGDEHPHKLLYSYLDLNGNPIESYTYASFLRRTRRSPHTCGKSIVSRPGTGFCSPIRRGSR